MSNGHNGFPMATPIAFRTSGKSQWFGRDVLPIFMYFAKQESLSKNGIRQYAFIFILAADLSNYHYQGRTRGYLGGGGPVSSPVTGGVTTGPHRPTVFRTGWE